MEIGKWNIFLEGKHFSDYVSWNKFEKFFVI